MVVQVAVEDRVDAAMEPPGAVTLEVMVEAAKVVLLALVEAASVVAVAA